MTNKLEKILQVLSDNHEIEIMVSEKKNDQIELSQTINIFIAPKTPTLDNAKLKELLGVIQSSIEIKSRLKPSSGGYPLNWTFMRFDEILGQTTIRQKNTLSAKDEFSLGKFGGTNEKVERKEMIKREIFIRLFPNIELAKANHRIYQKSLVFETRASLLSYHHD